MLDVSASVLHDLAPTLEGYSPFTDIVVCVPFLRGVAARSASRHARLRNGSDCSTEHVFVNIARILSSHPVALAVCGGDADYRGIYSESHEVRLEGESQ
jgi:hypothetical protein